MSYPSKLITCIGVPAGLLGVAAATRLAAQEGIPFYPDSYQFMLLARQLTVSLPVQASLGMGGDAWGIPFHRVGYGFVAGMGTVAAMYFVAGLAFRSWWAGFLAGAVTAVSFHCPTWGPARSSSWWTNLFVRSWVRSRRARTPAWQGCSVWRRPLRI